MHFLVCLVLGERADGVGRSDNYSNYHKDTEHTDAHISQIFYEIRRIKFKHITYPFLHKEAENERAGDNRSYLSRHVDTYCVHKKEVLAVSLKSHFMYYSS